MSSSWGNVVTCHQRVVASLLCGSRMRAAIIPRTRQAPLARRPRVEEAIHAHALHRRHDGLDVAVLGRGDNLEELLGGGEALALQGAPNEFNDVGEIGRAHV